MRVWIDADACPRAARDLVVKFALKRTFEVVLVANRPQRPDPDPLPAIVAKYPHVCLVY